MIRNWYFRSLVTVTSIWGRAILLTIVLHPAIQESIYTSQRNPTRFSRSLVIHFHQTEKKLLKLIFLSFFIVIFYLLYILAGKTRSGPQPSVREEIPIKRTFGLYEKYFISSIFFKFLIVYLYNIH